MAKPQPYDRLPKQPISHSFTLQKPDFFSELVDISVNVKKLLLLTGYGYPTVEAASFWGVLTLESEN